VRLQIPNSRQNKFVDWKSSAGLETNPPYWKSTSLPEGTEDVANQKRATVETLGIRFA